MNPYKENKAIVKIQYIGHATLLIESGGKIIIDPYLKDKRSGREGLERYNPNAALSVEDVEEINPDLILLTHGHGDHFGQTFELLKKTEAKLITSNKICDFVKKRFSEQRLLRIEPNEKIEFDNLTIFALEARHKHGLEGFIGDVLGMFAYKRFTPCGTNMGYLISVEGKKIYHSGDTYIVKIIYNPDVAFLSMDGLRTLNEKEAVETIREIKPKTVVPIHYRWHRNGERIVKNVKKAIENGGNILFKEMTYGEIIDV